MLRLAKEGKATGLRVDHIDGLYDPMGYLSQLRSRLAPERGKRPASPFYVVVVITSYSIHYTKLYDFDLLDRLLSEQPYWLSYWRLANEEINYRRFFAISDLISVRVEDPKVFEASHALVLRLAKKGKIV